MQEEDTDTPLTRQLLLWLRRYFWFESYTLSDPDKDARRRAAWPRWRRAVRPIGATAWWVGFTASVIYGDKRPHFDSYGGLFTVCYVVVGCCLMIWAVGRIREYRRGRVAVR